VVGLGTGRAANAFVEALGVRVRHGLQVRGVPTSEATADLAKRLASLSLRLMRWTASMSPSTERTKSIRISTSSRAMGARCVREKIVAVFSRRLIIVVGEEKLVSVLGARGKLPVEVIPFGLPLCRRCLEDAGCKPELRLAGERPFVTDNGNHILDCRVSPITNPKELEDMIRAIPGVVGTGLFIGMAEAVVIETSQGVEVRRRPEAIGTGKTPCTQTADRQPTIHDRPTKQPNNQQPSNLPLRHDPRW